MKHRGFAVAHYYRSVGSLKTKIQASPCQRKNTPHAANFSLDKVKVRARETHFYFIHTFVPFPYVLQLLLNQPPPHAPPSPPFVLRCSVIRMFLQRCRYLRAKVALRAWRTDHSVPVLQCLRGEVLRQKTIEIGLQSVSEMPHNDHYSYEYCTYDDTHIYLHAARLGERRGGGGMSNFCCGQRVRNS